ncbi:MAG: FecR domain-containing protein [Planctomycetota bacterium]|jgi:ferric-dicitrate binding protein FerR (iron transport regulator)
MEPDRLLNHYFHGTLTDEEFHQLETWLRSDPAHVAHFVRESFIQRSLSDHLRGECIQENICQVPFRDYDVFSDHLSDTSVWQALLEAERAAPGVEREVKSPEPEQPDSDKKTARDKRRSKFWPTVTVFSTAAAFVLLLLGIVEHIRSQRAVAELGDSLHARWAQTPDSNDLRAGPLELREGVAEITLKDGARVLIQAPCEFELLSANHMKLAGGSVTAFVPEQARGFRVITPQSEIVDFGTKFGVSVASSTAYAVHVFEGWVGLEPDPRQTGTGKRKDLRDGQSAVADASGSVRVEALMQRPKRFLQQMPDAYQIGIPGKRLNLADVVGGGNGFGTGRIGGSALRDQNQGTKVGWPINCVKLGAGQTITIDGVVTAAEYDGAQPVVINTHTATGIDPYRPRYRHQMFGAPFLPNQWRDTSLDDFNATYYIMWDDENLYVAMSCQDDEYVWSGLPSVHFGTDLQ